MPPSPEYYQTHFNSVAFDAQGRVLVNGYSDLFDTNDPDVTQHLLSRTDVIVRISDSGQLDVNTFNTTAIASLATSAPGEEFFRIGKVLGDGRIVLVGTNVAQLNADGSIDTNYGSNGVSGIEQSLGSYQVASPVADDGSVIVVTSPVNGTFGVRRVNSNGRLDKSFGDNGKVILASSLSLDTFSASIATAPDGTIDALGETGELSPSGKVDTRAFAVAARRQRRRPSGSTRAQDSEDLQPIPFLQRPHPRQRRRRCKHAGQQRPQAIRCRRQHTQDSLRERDGCERRRKIHPRHLPNHRPE